VATFGIEVMGGIAILLGWYTRQWAALLLIFLGVVIWIKWPVGWTYSNTGGGWEYPLFWLIARDIGVRRRRRLRVAEDEGPGNPGVIQQERPWSARPFTKRKRGLHRTARSSFRAAETVTRIDGRSCQLLYGEG
jgi:hypothetical protein